MRGVGQQHAALIGGQQSGSHRLGICAGRQRAALLDPTQPGRQLDTPPTEPLGQSRLGCLGLLRELMHQRAQRASDRIVRGVLLGRQVAPVAHIGGGADRAEQRLLGVKHLLHPLVDHRSHQIGLAGEVEIELAAPGARQGADLIECRGAYPPPCEQPPPSRLVCDR